MPHYNKLMCFKFKVSNNSNMLFKKNSCNITFDRVGCVLTLQLTLSCIPVILSFLFSPHLPGHILLLPSFSCIPSSFSCSSRGDAVTYARLQHQKQGDEERMTGTTNGAPEWGICLSSISLFSSPLLSSQLIFLLSIIHPTSFFTGLSPLSQWYWVYLFTELLHSCCSDLYHWFGLFGICRLNGIHDKLYLRLSFYVLLCHKSFFQFTYLLPESLSEDLIRN